MSIHRIIVLFAAVLAVAASLQAQNLVNNGGFKQTTARIDDGSIPPNQVGGWSGAYGSPQIINADGCQDPGYIAMWGNQVVGEAISQPLALKKGVRYDVSLCARYRRGNVANAHVALRASTAPLGSPACPAATCEAMAGAKNVTATTWTPYRFQFTPSRDYTYLTISTSNDLAIDDGAKVSWAEVDNVAIAPAGSASTLAPLFNADAPGAIRDQYVVLFKPGTPLSEVTAVEAQVAAGRGTILFRYRTSVLGFGARFGQDVLTLIRANPRVASVEADQVIKLDYVTQTNPPKGIDRTDRRLLTPNNKYQYTETGAGVHAYVIDTGIRTTHTEFSGRASGGFTAVTDGNGTNDCNGHGTHVAGTIGGVTYGIAKNVLLHPVRVLDCNGSGTLTGVIAGVDWVTNNKTLPAVANMSLSGNGIMPSLDTAVTNSIASGVTYVIAAANSGADACNYSPAHVPSAITVGAIDPANDTRAGFSNYGTCVDLFAPGVGILSAWYTNDTATNSLMGTSMAAPHVAGVASLALQLNNAATPAAVWNKIHSNDDISTTQGWPGILNAGPGSPNELLHWGPLSDGYDDGDPHITTVDGTRYNFQSAGEFVLLRGGGVEIQTRQTPVATTFNPGPDPYDGLATCVSLNTAVAARAGSHRVSYQPNISGVPDPSGMQLRIDGVLTPLTAQGVHLSGGGRVAQTAVGNGLEIQFPDDTILTAVPGWWGPQGKWYLNVQVSRTRATDGIMGAIAQGSWLPALPDGRSLGPMPATLHQRFVDLNQTFADAWRVTQSTSLFDYATGTSTATFTLRSWPAENGPCALPQGAPVTPAEPAVAQNACSGILGENARADCVFDVRVTGETGFAKTYLVTQQLKNDATVTKVTSDKATSMLGEAVTFTANVSLLTPKIVKGMNIAPAGTVQFVVDGARAGGPLPLDANGRAKWTTTQLSLNTHQISALYSPAPGTPFLKSSSANLPHTVSRRWIDTATEVPAPKD